MLRLLAFLLLVAAGAFAAAAEPTYGMPSYAEMMHKVEALLAARRNMTHGEVRAECARVAEYPSHDEMVADLRVLAGARGDMELREFGESVKGRPLVAVVVARHGRLRADRPAALLVGNIHGDETASREVLLALLRDLAAEGPFAVPWPDIDLVVVPSLNPDGFAACTRSNAKGKDMNRCFPYRCAPGRERCSAADAPEVHALMRLVRGMPLSASVGFHGGAVAVSLPWDSRCGAHGCAVPEPHPEIGMHREIARAYMDGYAGRDAPLNDTTINGVLCWHEAKGRPGTEVRDGVVVGSWWYQLAGGMQGWALAGGPNVTAALTVELTDVKIVPHAEIGAVWAAHEESLRNLLAALRQGATVRAVDEHGAPVPDATVYLLRGGAADPLSARTLGADGVLARTLPRGVSALAVGAPGYEGAYTKLDVGAGEHVEWEAVLRKME